jgi:transcriptional regulator with XRE-family HTH domain/tetratricopeptide (TPR) repeat protein
VRDFGRRLRQLRLDARLTQEELAERSGLSVRTIRNLEAGRGSPRRWSLRALAGALGIEAEDGALLLEVDPAPATLPADVVSFTGREPALAALDALLGEVRVATVTGIGGVGKTALAVHWAHRVRKHFPDGQLHVDLRGFDPGGAPVTPTDAMRGVLDALGVPAGRIPADAAALAGLYRSGLDGRRCLLLLDNAADGEQVRPLLPGSPAARVLVTSRAPLLGLVATHEALPVPLEPLDGRTAQALLRRRVGDRLDREPVARDALVRRCAGLPLALALVAARAVVDPAAPMAALVTEIRERGTGPALAVTGDPAADPRQVFGWSYAALEPADRRLFRLVGLHPGPDLSGPAAAGLAGDDPATVAAGLGRLVEAGLLGERVPGRYALHDLLREFAAERAAAEDPAAERAAAATRLLDHYLHSAVAADRRLEPERDPLHLPAPAPGVRPEEPADAAAAIAWFSAERPVLMRLLQVAREAGADRHVWQLAWSLVAYFDLQGHWADFTASQQEAVAAARRLGDRAAEGRALRHLANAHLQLGDAGRARTNLGAAVELSAAMGDPVGEANAHLNLYLLHERDGDLAAGAEHASRALALYRAAGHRVGEAAARNSLGFALAHLGDPAAGREHCTAALATSRQSGNRLGEAHARDSLGFICSRLGDRPAAVEHYDAAIELFVAGGDRYNEAATLLNLGDAQAAGGDLPAAVSAWERAAAILDEIEHPRAVEAHARLDGVRR